MLDEHNKFASWAGEKGWLLAGEALEEVSTATTVSIRDGQRIVTDGPFAETKEHLGGYYVIDVPSLDDAIETAFRIPDAAAGRVEIRPDQGVRLIDAAAPGPGDVVDRVFREEHGRAIATLIRVLGDFDLAEEAVADAYVTALERWPADGVPNNPGPGSRRPPATARSTGSVATACSPRRPRSWPAMRRSTRRPARARCSQRWRTRCTRSRTTSSG